MLVMRRFSLPASTRWVGRQFESKRQTPTPRWHTARPSSSSASMPSGPAWPPESWIATPVLESVPPAMSGSRQICCERVMATYTCVLLLLSVMPLGEGALVVGDENPAALVDLQPVRPAVVLNDELPFSFRVDAEYAPEGNVHAPQVSLAVERGTFEEAVHLRSAPVGVGPGGAALLAELRGQRSVRPRLDAFDFLERVVHGKTPGGDAKHNPTRGKPTMGPRNARCSS